jgi:hypothetical protein
MLASVLLFAFLLSSPAAQPKTAPTATAVQVRPIPDDAVRQNQRLVQKLSPSARSKVQSAAAAVATAIKQQPSMTPAQLQAKARGAVTAAFPGLAGMDIDAVVFLVMMQAAQDQEKDLQQTMNQMQQETNAKQAARGTAQSGAAAQANSAAQMSDMSTEQQMRLQMAMDRRSKFLDTISNMMKSASDTQTSVISNLK